MQTMKLALAAALLSLPSLVHAAQLVWSGSGDARNAELKLSEPGTERIPLSFWCEAGADVVYVSYEFKPARAFDGVEVDFTLRAGAIELPVVHAVGLSVEIDDSFNLEGQMEFNQRFVDFITSEETLTATAEGRSETFSLAGARQVAQPLLGMCAGT